MTVRGVRGSRSTARRPETQPLSQSQSSGGSNVTVRREDLAQVVVAPAPSAAGSPDRPLHDLGMRSGMTTEEVLRREPLIRNALRIIAPQPKFFEACHLDVVDSIVTIEVTTAYWKKEIGPLKS